jgi:hypothetical protein
MSLKAVHLVFVNALSAMAFGCGAWKFRDFLGPAGSRSDLIYALGGFLGGILVVWYGRYFLKKLKSVGYL